MPVLPSGRFVDITADRARFHAARTGLRVKAKTPHVHLYALVDILVEHPRATGATRRIDFSGHTLADVGWLRKWDGKDREFFAAWVREAPQFRVIEQARRRLLAEDVKPREYVFDYPERLYSSLRTRVGQLNLPRAKAPQWRQTLLNLQNDGIRPEELEWSGILGVLDGLSEDRVIDKAVITDSMDFSAIRPRLSHELVCAQGCSLPFVEVAQKLKGYQLQQAGLPVGDDDIGVIRLSSEEPPYKIGVLWPGGRTISAGTSSTWFVLGPYGEVITDGTSKKRKLFESQDRAIEVAKSNALRNGRVRCDMVENARYDYMTLHGGTQYREWLVTLPEYAHTHFSGHYYERNILAHIRTKIRETQNGERVLFVEELQSDWHQALARRAARGIIPRAPFRNDWAALAMKLMLLHVVAEDLDGIAWANGKIHELRYDKPLPPLRRLYDKTIPDAFNRLMKPWGVKVGHGVFDTRSPWLCAVRDRDVWRVEGGGGKFSTRARYTKYEAMRVVQRHSKAVSMTLPMVLINDDIRVHIATHGLPLFGGKIFMPSEGRNP